MIELDKKRYYTKKETAALLHISERSVTLRIWNRDLHTMRVGRYAYISEEEIKAYLKACEKKGREARP